MSLDLTDSMTRRRAYIRIAQKRLRPGTGSNLEMLRSRTWRLPVFPLKSIAQTPFVVVGGVATRLYAPERMTDDLDVLVAAEEAERFYGNCNRRAAEAGQPYHSRQSLAAPEVHTLMCWRWRNPGYGRHWQGRLLPQTGGPSLAFPFLSC